MIIIKAGCLDRYLELKNKKSNIIEKHKILIKKRELYGDDELVGLFIDGEINLLRVNLINLERLLLDICFEMPEEQSSQKKRVERLLMMNTKKY